jgi:extradiol dioxygenase family protein
MNKISPFHLAIPITDLESTRKFYGKLLGCTEGRNAEKWIDWNFFGHQLSTHIAPNETTDVKKNPVDGKQVPCRHFGIILDWTEWHELKEKLEKQNTYEIINFIIEPYIRFKGQTGEQATMFFLDESNNALEFKAFKNPSQLFAT